MDPIPAGPLAEADRYIGYWEPYAISHAAYDKDEGFHGEILNAALTLRDAVLATTSGDQVSAGSGLEPPREK